MTKRAPPRLSPPNCVDHLAAATIGKAARLLNQMCCKLHFRVRRVPTLRGGVMDLQPYEVDDVFCDRDRRFSGHRWAAGGG
ncbi:MAG: hypothetical protein AAF622_13515 [Cyanobacteria bacterium P01_C01_bin.147]